MAYPTLPELKARLGIEGTAQDDFLTASLAAARGAVENYTGYRWEYPDPETRVFDLWDTDRRDSVFDVGDPGLLSYTGIEAWRRSESPIDLVASDDILLRRNNPRGDGPYQRLLIRGVYDFAQVTGVFGRGLTAPCEIGECVMLIAMNLFAQGAGLGLPAGADVDYAIFQDDLVYFLVRGWRRFR